MKIVYIAFLLGLISINKNYAFSGNRRPTFASIVIDQ
jgi:hypothetical protein